MHSPGVRSFTAVFACLLLLACPLRPQLAAGAFVRGDAHADGAINMTDAISILSFLFLGGDEPACLDAADTDNNEVVQLTDGIFILNFLFLGGEAPPAPGLDCGEDPAEPDDGLGCETFDSCG